MGETKIEFYLLFVYRFNLLQFTNMSWSSQIPNPIVLTSETDSSLCSTSITERILIARKEKFEIEKQQLDNLIAGAIQSCEEELSANLDLHSSCKIIELLDIHDCVINHTIQSYSHSEVNIENWQTPSTGPGYRKLKVTITLKTNC